MSIRLNYYAITGYGTKPSYQIPDYATPHLVEHGASLTLCGVKWTSQHDRVTKDGMPAWKHEVCDKCRAIEPTIAPMKVRKGDCPVLSERTGEPHKHILTSYRPRCKDCPEPKWNRRERCGNRHNTYAHCTSCGYVDKEHHYCDYTVGRSMGMSTDFGACDKRAYEQRHVLDRYHQGTGAKVWLFLCKQHLPESIQKRKDESDARMRAYFAESDAKEAARRSRNDAFDLAVEMARWIAQNHDLAEEDEWLNQIATQVAANATIQEALGEGRHQAAEDS